jgi:hypothetical protein
VVTDDQRGLVRDIPYLSIGAYDPDAVAPGMAIPGLANQGVNLGNNLAFAPGNFNAIRVNDPAAGANIIQVTLTATNGSLTLSGTTGLSFSFSDSNGTGAGTGTNDTTMTF